MNKLSRQHQAQVVAALVEGNSIRSIERMTGVAKHTILKLIKDVGIAAADYQDRTLVNLTCKRLQLDECWQFCYAKNKNVPADKRGQFGFGDVWCWVAIDSETKLAPSFLIGNRDYQSAHMFVEDLASRLVNRPQITSDGLKVYINAVESAFGANVDFAMLHKIYASSQEEVRYSPAQCIGCEKKRIMGNPDPLHVSTSFVERQNLTMRMHMRRFTRLTNGHSKKIENRIYAVALHFMFYNFAKIHQSLRVTPAMETGVSNHVWNIGEIVDLIPQPIALPRGPYKKRA
jgi:IS1 family transposase